MKQTTHPATRKRLAEIREAKRAQRRKDIRNHKAQLYIDGIVPKMKKYFNK